MGRHPDDVCVFGLDSFGFAQITSDRLGFCHTADISACNLGRGRQQDLLLHFLGLAERARQRLMVSVLPFSKILAVMAMTRQREGERLKFEA